MAGSFSQVTLVGNVGSVEAKMLPSGDPVTSFSVAVNKRWKTRDGQQQEKTTWYACEAFQRNAENAAQYLQTGTLVLVIGEPDIDVWSDRQSGDPRGKLKVQVNRFTMLSSKQDGQQNGNGNAPASRAAQPLLTDDDVLI